MENYAEGIYLREDPSLSGVGYLPATAG
uniref:Uncharacterized protein n=1 Tax=Cucumber mosaic virus satellite RNA TaxID=12436 RepID=Q66269_9VIRU|nr:unnamed protein product [Cucumber mosaic virus satellite RNA]